MDLPAPTRLHGVDRYDQAVRASRAGFARADIVYLASGEKFADALSAGAVAGARGSPLLLTPATGLPAGVVAEIGRLSPSVVVMVGGPASVSDEVVAELSRSVVGATFLRIGGADRYEVSRALVTDSAVGVPTADGVMLAAGATFPDALAAAPAAVHREATVMLVDGSKPSLDSASLTAISGYRPHDVLIVGGIASVSPGIESQLRRDLASVPSSVGRVSGADRFEVPVTLNRGVFAPRPGGSAYLASGTAFPDALSGGPLAASRHAPIYLVRQDCVPVPVLDDLRRLAPEQIVLLGGPATLSPAVETLTPC
ncbi:cell wall-binding repeat-containing protein [Herbiconiux sp. P15]|uniref:cell wall-binding repeat-containing protein n=1 Tax=Herbiconiux liukaitaii TaxID=3342799 RepID=UPI0035BA406C